MTRRALKTKSEDKVPAKSVNGLAINPKKPSTLPDRALIQSRKTGPVEPSSDNVSAEHVDELAINPKETFTLHRALIQSQRKTEPVKQLSEDKVPEEHVNKLAINPKETFTLPGHEELSSTEPVDRAEHPIHLEIKRQAQRQETLDQKCKRLLEEIKELRKEYWNAYKDNDVDEIVRIVRTNDQLFWECLNQALDAREIQLIDKLLPPDQRDEHYGVFVAAARKGEIEKVKLLVEHYGFDINFANEEKVTQNEKNISGKIYRSPLIEAISEGRIDIVKYFLQKGARLQEHVSTFNRNTALTSAIRHGHLEIAKLILEQKVEPSWLKKTNALGQNACYLAKLRYKVAKQLELPKPKDWLEINDKIDMLLISARNISTIQESSSLPNSNNTPSASINSQTFFVTPQSDSDKESIAITETTETSRDPLSTDTHSTTSALTQ